MKTTTKVAITTQLITLTVFLGLATWQFYTGNHTNGVLWLIMAEVYNIRVKVDKSKE